MRISRTVAASIVLALLCAEAFAQKRSIGLEDLGRDSSAPLATGIEWRPDSKGFRFTRSDRSYIYPEPPNQPLPLPDCNRLCQGAAPVPEPPAFEWQNRGVKESETQWCGDNRHILVKFKGDLFWMDTAADAKTPMRQLTQTLYDEADPKLSPDCKYVSFRKDYDL